MFTPSEEEVLRECFERGGCLRIRQEDPARGKHAGVELRLVVTSPEEKREVIRALRALKIRHGRPYHKQRGSKRVVVPVYSRKDVVLFLKSVKPKGYAALVKKVLATAKRPVPLPKK